MPKKTVTLRFELPGKDVLNANKSLHEMVKAKLARQLKHLAFDEGVKKLDEETAAIISKRRALIDSEENNKVIRKRLTKKFKTIHPNATLKEIKELVDAEIINQGLELNDRSADVAFTPLFENFRITAIVSGPTARRLDPPNFSPTTKPLIDGLTWAGFWADDDGSHLRETSFRQAPKNNTKNFVIILKIDELTNDEARAMDEELTWIEADLLDIDDSSTATPEDD